MQFVGVSERNVLARLGIMDEVCYQKVGAPCLHVCFAAELWEERKQIQPRHMCCTSIQCHPKANAVLCASAPACGVALQLVACCMVVRRRSLSL